MKIRIIYSLVICFTAIISVLTWSSCADRGQDQTEVSVKHTCPMHPQVVKDGPGSCPICGMDLVPVNSSGAADELSLSESQIQLANIRTMQVSSGSFSAAKILNARLITNPGQSEIISSRYAGRIEKLFVQETGRRVNKGQPLFQIYSEELQTLQQDYLLQQRQTAAFPNEQIYQSLLEAAGNKLRLFGYSGAQIRSLELANKTSPLVTVYSSRSGVVTEISISEGQYVAEGGQVFRLENYDQLWVEADVYPAEISAIKPGTPVKVSVNGISEKEQTVKIDFISPQMDPSTQIVKVRAPIENPGNLQAGMQASMILPVSVISSAVSLPLDAVIRNEEGSHVWIKTGENTFSPRTVITGDEDSEQVIIRSGLENVKEVVISGAYLLTGEFILKRGADPMAGHDMNEMR